MASASTPNLRGPRAPQTVIDLTDDTPPFVHSSRPPQDTSHPTSQPNLPRRFSADVIDVDAIPDPPAQNAGQSTSASPDVEVTFSRSRAPRPHHPTNVARPAQPIEPEPIGDTFGRPRGPGNAFAVGRRRAPGGIPRELQDMLLSRHDAIEARFNEANFRGNNRTAGNHGPRFHLNGGHLNEALRIVGAGPANIENFVPPAIDYNLVALHNDGASAPAPAPPTYQSPPPAREGFTRSPAEDDVIVCPNCDDELGVGESDEKRSVWYTADPVLYIAA
ncbi:MAG: hypothetical protein M1833_007342 [Piccolia ochrophora]|nr:MAG: hypothetical protein M1833_007342 [Piccolia ochrophora]